MPAPWNCWSAGKRPGRVGKPSLPRRCALVALKMILAGAHAGREQRARFIAEAEAVARLQHANIVQIHEIGEQDGCPFFSLEYMDGGSLARAVGSGQWAVGSREAVMQSAR